MMSNEALKISDVAFVVTSQIERAPHWTMFRELTMNALEAAARASGEKIVHWTTGTTGAHARPSSGILDREWTPPNSRLQLISLVRSIRASASMKILASVDLLPMSQASGFVRQDRQRH
jgi:hypothetical protein